jgi:hypothetical protein
MTMRTLVTVHLPLEMGAVGRIMRAVAREYPDAVVLGKGGAFELQADDDLSLTIGARRRIVRDRERASRAESIAAGLEEAGS